MAQNVATASKLAAKSTQGISTKRQRCNRPRTGYKGDSGEGSRGVCQRRAGCLWGAVFGPSGRLRGKTASNSFNLPILRKKPPPGASWGEIRPIRRRRQGCNLNPCPGRANSPAAGPGGAAAQISPRRPPAAGPRGARIGAAAAARRRRRGLLHSTGMAKTA